MARHPLATRARWAWYRHAGLRWALVAATAVLALAAVARPGPAPPGPSGPPGLVARHDLAVGQRIEATDLAPGPGPSGHRPAERVADPVGKVVTAPILAGEPVVASRVAPGGRQGVAALVPAGHRALALPVTVAPLPVVVGDRVDVLTTAADGNGTRVVARGAPVVAVSEAAVTVALPAGQAATTAEGLAGGVVTLALQGPEP